MNEIITIEKEHNTQLTEYENSFMKILEHYSLPTENVLVNVKERMRVFKNLDEVIEGIPFEKLIESTYISKFMAAVSIGLFDAALSYLWDETIVVIRKKIIQYDISYFLEQSSLNEEKKKQIKSEEDLSKLDDYELIKGAKEIELISDIGYKHLDYIRDMRNWMSAAHPNHSEFSGVQLVGWLEQCINEVINASESNIAVEVRKILKNVKTNVLAEITIKDMCKFIIGLPKHKSDKLAFGLLGIYTENETNQTTHNNIKSLYPSIWSTLDKSTKYQIGMRIGKYSAIGDEYKKEKSIELLKLVDGESFLPKEMIIVRIDVALDELESAHYGSNNFYTEPTYVKNLKSVIGDNPIPNEIEPKYVKNLVNAYITNGYGKCWEAEPMYIELIKNFSSTQQIYSLLLIVDEDIKSKFRNKLCVEKYKSMITHFKDIIGLPLGKDLCERIIKFSGNLDKFSESKEIEKIVDTLKKGI